jgi:hypothetical protein
MKRRDVKQTCSPEKSEPNCAAEENGIIIMDRGIFAAATGAVVT